MIDKPRGLTCSLPDGAVKQLIQFVARKAYSFYVPWCMRVDRPTRLLPAQLKEQYLTADELGALTAGAIWELILQMYPFGCRAEKLDGYEDFLGSPCICCLVYYDCGALDVYVKDSTLYTELLAVLQNLKAEDFSSITEEKDFRLSL